MLRSCKLSQNIALRLTPSALSRPTFRSYASSTDIASYPKVGERVHGFTLQRIKHVPELELTALQLRHDKTGAEHLHIARNDSNNVFSIGFKTNPPDDTGVPHILEHTTLCGSERFPVRDPFFKMLRRSLSNFMNAFTSSDHTSYPFATTNTQDYNNLMSVYLDATLHPLLKENDFTQEGWRIGPANPLASSLDGEANSDENIVFKGVVYNEMKGQMSDASYLFYVRFQDHLFPDINNSGGDPQKITDLTWQQLRAFHAEHYHPSNAKIFTYGDMSLASHLKEIDRRLDRFDPITIDASVKHPISLDDGPKFVNVQGPIDPLVSSDLQHKTSTTWLLCDTSDVLETFSLSILSSLLLDGYGSPLYKGLIENGLGTDWSPNTGFDSAGKTGVFSVGLTGVQKMDVSKVRETLFDTLRATKQEGFDDIKVHGMLHQLELGLRHKTAHFGMGVMQRLTPGWFNGVDPMASLAWNDTVEAFKHRYAQGGYLEGLLEKYLLNDRTLTFTMEPVESFGAQLAEEERARLASKILEATKGFATEEEAHRFLKEREIGLLQVQETARHEDISSLPTVHVENIPRTKAHDELRHTSMGSVPIQWREAETNGLTYFRAINLLQDLPEDLRGLIPLFADSIMRLGTRDKTMEQIEEMIKLKTGGISLGYHVSTSPYNIEHVSEGLALSGYALDSNVGAVYDLLKMVVMETDFDSASAEQRIRQLLQASASGTLNSIAETGHSYARKYTEAGLSGAGAFTEQTSGLTQAKLITSLATRPVTDSLGDVLRKLKTIQSLALVNAGSLRVALTCSKDSSSTNEQDLHKFVSALPTAAVDVASNRTEERYSRNAKTFFSLPYQVYYSALAVPTVPYTDVSGASLAVLSQLLTHKHLHHEIREKGGAYGGGAYSSALGGVFGFYSYRDPNPQNSLTIMEGAGTWAREQHWSERELEEAKLSVFQSIDAPRSVSEDGMTQFLSGVDQSMQQRRREQLLDVTKQDVANAADRFLVQKMASSSNITVLGEQRAWITKNDGWDVRNLGMQEDVQQAAEDLQATPT